MNDLIRLKALRAAAKVALSLTVVGCAGNVQFDAGESNPGPPEDDSDSVVVADPEENEVSHLIGVTMPDPEDGKLMCEAPPVGEQVEIDEAQLACCVEFIEPLTPQNTDWDSWSELAANDADVAACCNVAVHNAEQDFEAVDWQLVQSCCLVGGLEGPACTPWGPPMPPCASAGLPQLFFGEVA